MKVLTPLKITEVIIFLTLLLPGQTFGQTEGVDENGIPWNIYPPGYMDQPQKQIDTFTTSENNISHDTIISTGQLESQLTDQTTSQIYQITDLGTLNGTFSAAYEINNKGEVVGESYGHAFLYSNGTMNDLGTWNGNSTVAYGINDAGQVVGKISVAATTHHAFRYSPGSLIVDLDNMDYHESSADAVNNNGIAAGHFGFNACIFVNGLRQFLGSLGGTVSFANGINDNGEVVGRASLPNGMGYRAFLYSNGNMKDIGTLGGNLSTAEAINNNGLIVGGADTVDGVTHAFLYLNGSMMDLGVLDVNSYAFDINNLGQIVGLSPISGSNQHAFLYSNGSIKDLNNFIDSDSGWTLQRAYGINDWGQIVGIGVNPQGYTHAFLLNPLPSGAKEKIEEEPLEKTFGPCIEKQPGMDNLIVVTHGWYSPVFNPPIINPPDLTWIDSMSNSIVQYLDSHNLTNWQAYGYKWLDNAYVTFPTHALNNAREEGANLGSCIAIQGWKHVHLIGHSAGSQLIDTASKWIKTISPTTTIQCTFLDAYVGKDYAGATNYGSAADWSDSYFSRDTTTRFGSILTGPFTESPLNYAYNVDVTTLDPNKLEGIAKFHSSATGEMEPCYTTITSHSWPHQFYLNTISGNITSNYVGFGFPLSMEGGNWGHATNIYVHGSLTNLGIPDPTCMEDINVETPAWFQSIFNFLQSPTAWKSPTGTIQEGNHSIQMNPGSPVWIGKIINLTNPVNYVSFDMEFVDINNISGELLSIYWDSETIGSIDKRAADPGLQKYLFTFPNSVAGSTHVLGFRLDPFTNTSSSVILTNVFLGQAGVSQPFSLTITTNKVNELPVWKLSGQPGFKYVVQATTNLMDWTDIAILLNTNGTVQFFDRNSTNYDQRFYRVAVPN